MNNEQMPMGSRTLFGHPTGLFALFFAEMWERFSYYGMRALLLFYMMKGFLGYGDKDAYSVYGAYTALVYMTPFFGGMLADRLLGQRRAVVLGGLLMAAGHLLMTIQDDLAFFTALALLICGNGFFKPNISTIVGSLYPPGSPRREGGFTIFYMGVNLGAAMSPLLCGYIGETYGYHYGFGLATIGMLTGIAVFVAPTLLTQILIMSGAVAAAVSLLLFHPDNPFATAANVLVGLSLLVAGVIALTALGRGGLPAMAGAPPDANRLRRPLIGPISLEWVVYLGTLISIPLFTLLVSGLSPLTENKRPVAMVPEAWIKDLSAGQFMHAQLKDLRKAVRSKSVDRVDRLVKRFDKLHEQKDEGKHRLADAPYAALTEVVQLAKGQQWEDAEGKIKEVGRSFPPQRIKAILAVFLEEMSRPAGMVLLLAGLGALVYLSIETFRLDKVPRERMFVALILIFFSMLFWAFFEQAGSSVNNFTDRNVDRVFEQRRVTADELGKTISIQPTQEQVGFHNGEQLFTLDVLDKLREKKKQQDEDLDFEIQWTVAEDNEGMGIAKRTQEMPASTFQSVNPIYILVFGLAFTALWTFLAQRGLEPSTPVKFALGLMQLGIGFGAFWYGAVTADERGMVALVWLLVGYMFHTTGELCLSPVGLTMITKLSPARLVSTMMGTWFLATGFSQLLAAIIAQFTGVSDSGDGVQGIPPPSETVDVYGGVFGTIALTAIGCGLVCLMLVPLLKRWMHPDVEVEDET